MCCSDLECRIVAIVVRLVFLVLSVGGWIASVVGLSNVYSWSQSEESQFYTLSIPLWIFVISAVPLYKVLVVHTFMSQCFISRWRNNAGNIALAIVNFFKVFYLHGAGGTVIFAAILIAAKENIKLDESSAYYVLGGCTFSVLFYWISEILWPLFQLRCSQENMQENTIDLKEPFIIPQSLDTIPYSPDTCTQ